jgi:hypothetical protein
MAMVAPTWTVTIRADDHDLGASICASTGTITRFTAGALADFHASAPDSLALGDRIIEVEGKTGQACELLGALLQDGKLTGELRVKLLRPLMVQPMVVQMQPGEQLGLDVDIANTNTIQCINAGLVADLNKVYPGAIEVGDRIREVDGKEGNAVEQIRAWVQDHKDAPGDLQFAVARQATWMMPVRCADGQCAAWHFSVVLRIWPGESLGAVLRTDVNAIDELEEGAISNLNKAHPGAVQVGDRIVAVDGVPCPRMTSSAEVESWFQGRKPRKDIPRDIQLTLLRPVDRAANVTVLPPYEFKLVEVDARLESKSTAAMDPTPPKGERSEDERSAGESTSTTDLRQIPDAAGEKLPNPAKSLSTPVPLEKFVDGKVRGHSEGNGGSS